MIIISSNYGPNHKAHKAHKGRTKTLKNNLCDRSHIINCCGPFARRARMHACWLALGRAGGRSGRRARWRTPPVRTVLLARDFQNNDRLLIILADNYNHTTNDPTTEAQSARRTHRDFFSRDPMQSSGFAILARYRKQRRAAAGPRSSAARVPVALVARRSWARPSGLAADVVRAGWLSWQAIVQC
jgi:hypothetical protein